MAPDERFHETCGEPECPKCAKLDVRPSKTGLALRLAGQLADAVRKDEAPEEGGFDLSGGMFGRHVSEWLHSVAVRLPDETAAHPLVEEAARLLRLRKNVGNSAYEAQCEDFLSRPAVETTARLDGTTHAVGCWQWGPKHYQCAIDHFTRMADALLNHCDKEGGECSECAKIVCPHGEPLHFHHDGCPACTVKDEVLGTNYKGK